MPRDVDKLRDRAREAKRESKYVEFKDRFDPTVEGEWIELIKDFAAIANSGGGVVVIGVANDASPSGTDVQPVLDLDGATIGDKLVRYVGQNFDDFEVHEESRNGNRVAAIVVGAAVTAPLVFSQPGNYTNQESRQKTEEGRQKTAFTRGAVYFRHGAKSEPATSADLEAFIERRLDEIRQKWLGGIKRVVAAPGEAEIVAIRRTESAEGGPRIRITTDQTAPLYGRISADETHPHRQTELISEVNKKLPGKKVVNTHDMLSVRRAHNIDHETQPEFVFQPRFGAPQYSDAFVDWIVGQYRRDKEFFTKAREAFYRHQHS